MVTTAELQGSTVIATHSQWMQILRLAKLTNSRRCLPIQRFMLLAPATGGMQAAKWGQGYGVSLRAFVPSAEVLDSAVLVPVDELWTVMRAISTGAVDVARSKRIVETTDVEVHVPGVGETWVRGFGREIYLAEDSSASRPPVSDFPELPSEHGPALARVLAGTLLRAWRFAAVAADPKHVVTDRTVVRIKFPDWSGLMQLDASDRYRGAEVQVEVDRLPAHRKPVDVALPAVLQRHLALLEGEVTIRLDSHKRATLTADRHMTFTGKPLLDGSEDPTVSITVTLADAVRFDWQKLTPEKMGHSWNTHRDRLIGDVKAAMAPLQRNEPITMQFCRDHVMVQGCPQRPAVSMTSTVMRTGFNPRFLLDALEAFDSVIVRFRAAKADKPFLIDGEIHLAGLTGQYLLMPVRLVN